MSVHTLTVKPRARGLLWSFLVGFLVVGVPYWRIPYNKATSAAVMGGAILIGAVPAAVMARVVVDTTRDPTSHNLWPFELVIAFLVGLAGTVPGALIGSVFRRMLGKR